MNDRAYMDQVLKEEIKSVLQEYIHESQHSGAIFGMFDDTQQEEEEDNE